MAAIDANIAKAANNADTSYALRALKRRVAVETSPAKLALAIRQWRIAQSGFETQLAIDDMSAKQEAGVMAKPKDETKAEANVPAEADAEVK